METWWIERGGSLAEPYQKEIHNQRVRKFLCWIDDSRDVSVIIADNGIDHRWLTFNAKKALEGKGLRPETFQGYPQGAGNANSGRVTTWESQGYNIVTKKSLRPMILEALGLIE